MTKLLVLREDDTKELRNFLARNSTIKLYLHRAADSNHIILRIVAGEINETKVPEYLKYYLEEQTIP